MAIRKFSTRYILWQAARTACQLYPPLAGPLCFHTETEQVVDYGPTERVTHHHSLGFSEAEQPFVAHLPEDFPEPVERSQALVHLNRATVLGNTGAIIDEAAKKLLVTRMMRPFATYHNFRPVPLRKVRRTKGPYFTMLGSHRGHRHLFHFIFDRLPSLFHLATRFEAGRRPLTILTNDDLPGFQRDAYEAVARRWPNLSFQSVPHTERWDCDDLLVLDNFQPVKSTFAEPEVIAFLREVFFDAYGIAPPARGTRRLYVSRGDTRKRRIRNEDALQGVIAHHGFESVEAARLSFPDQVRLFSEAELVAGPHGAGLTNALFAAPGGGLLEIFPQTKVKNTYFLMARSADLAYEPVIAGPGDRREWFEVDPGAADAALRRLTQRVSA